jgi:hypothetical protein
VAEDEIGGLLFVQQAPQTKRPPTPPRKKIPASRQNSFLAGEQHSTPSGQAGSATLHKRQPSQHYLPAPQ